MLALILLIMLLVLIITARRKNRRFNELSKILKHDIMSLPILGISYLFFGSDEDRMKALIRFGRESIKQNGIAFGWFAHYPIAVVSDPELAEYVSRHCLEKHTLMAKFYTIFFRTGSVNAPVSTWRPRRKSLVPIFSPKNLKQFVSIFAERSEVLVDQLKPTVGKPISIYDFIANYSIESVCESTLGVQLNVQKSAEPHPVVTAINQITHLMLKRLLQPWLHIDFVYKLLPAYKSINTYIAYYRNFAYQIIMSQKRRMQEEKPAFDDDKFLGKRKSLLESLMKSTDGKQQYTDDELTDEAGTLIGAGTDTSAVGSSFTALMLARHPDVQEKLYDELRQVLDDDTQSVTADHLPHLKYLEAVIRESIRLFPPIPVVIRIADKDISLPSGVVMPKDCGFIIHLWAINRNPRYWGADAEEFRPERFLDGSVKNPAQFSSFSLGPRNCVGFQYAMMSMKTALATLLRRYRVTPADSTTIHEPLRLSYAMMMKDVNNFMVQLELRN